MGAPTGIGVAHRLRVAIDRNEVPRRVRRLRPRRGRFSGGLGCRRAGLIVVR